MLHLGNERAEFAKWAKLFLLTYAFLLRLPSEALPIRAWRGENSLRLEGELGIASITHFPFLMC
jgi:hypothetical protein